MFCSALNHLQALRHKLVSSIRRIWYTLDKLIKCILFALPFLWQPNDEGNPHTSKQQIMNTGQDVLRFIYFAFFLLLQSGGKCLNPAGTLRERKVSNTLTPWSWSDGDGGVRKYLVWLLPELLRSDSSDATYEMLQVPHTKSHVYLSACAAPTWIRPCRGEDEFPLRLAWSKVFLHLCFFLFHSWRAERFN